MSTKTFAKTPSVFSFQRSLLVSDGAMFNLIRNEFIDHPLHVIRHGIRGTQNVNDGGGDSAKDSNARAASNIQQTESAKTAHDAQGAVVVFGLRMLDLRHALFACAADDVPTTNEVRASVLNFVERAKTSRGLEEVSLRFARNIANGSWLWRNRVIASNVRVEVWNEEKKLVEFDALSVPLDRFGDYSPSEKILADRLAAGLRGDRSASLEVRAFLEFGVRGAVEVFPSQAYIQYESDNSPKPLSRPLYKILLAENDGRAQDMSQAVRIVGQAALRDQKISNRLRTIDTWYDGYDLVGKPIPVEPNGASLEFMQFFRRTNKRSSAFDMLARLNVIDPDTEEGMFCIASMIRGGVYSGGSSKPKKAAAKGDIEQATQQVAEQDGEA